MHGSRMRGALCDSGFLFQSCESIIRVEEDGAYMLFRVSKLQHASNIIQGLPEELLDVWLQTEQREQVPFHSALLGASSPLLQCNQEPQVVVPQGVSKKTLWAVRSYLYEPQTFVDLSANWREVLDLASFLQMDHVVNGTLDPGFILDSLCSMYHQKIQTYLLVKCCDEEIPCHSAVVAASSPEMLKQVLHAVTGSPPPSVATLTLTTDSPRAAKLLMDFIYSGVLKMQWGDVFELYELAVCYEYDAVVEMCQTYIVQLVNPRCGPQFYHKAQDIANRCHTAATKELVTTLHAWVSLNFAEVIRCHNSVREFTEADWFEFLSWGYLSSGWHVEEVVGAAVHWYKQHVADRTGALCRIVASITALHGSSQQTDESGESGSTRRRLEDSLSVFVSSHGGHEILIDPDDMHAHCLLFQQHHAFLDHLRLSRHLQQKVAGVQEKHGACSEQILHYVEAERQQVEEFSHTYQQSYEAHQRMMRSMEEMRLQQSVQSQQIDMTRQRLVEQKKLQQEEHQILQHNQAILNQRKEEQQNQVKIFQSHATKLAESMKRQEEEEQAIEKRRQKLAEQVKKLEEEEEELRSRQNEHEKNTAEQKKEEEKLDKKQEQLGERVKEQQEEEEKLSVAKETLKKERATFEEEKREFEGNKETLEQKKRRLEKELRDNAEDFQKRLDKMKEDSANHKRHYDTTLKRHATKQKELEDQIEKLTKELHAEKQKLEQRMDSFEKK